MRMGTDEVLGRRGSGSMRGSAPGSPAAATAGAAAGTAHTGVSFAVNPEHKPPTQSALAKFKRSVGIIRMALMFK